MKIPFSSFAACFYPHAAPVETITQNPLVLLQTDLISLVVVLVRID